MTYLDWIENVDLIDKNTIYRTTFDERGQTYETYIRIGSQSTYLQKKKRQHKGNPNYSMVSQNYNRKVYRTPTSLFAIVHQHAQNPFSHLIVDIPSLHKLKRTSNFLLHGGPVANLFHLHRRLRVLWLVPSCTNKIHNKIH